MHITQSSQLFTDLTGSSYNSLKRKLQHTVKYIEQMSLPRWKKKKKIPVFLTTFFLTAILPLFHIGINVPSWLIQHISILFPHPFHSFLLSLTISSSKQCIHFQGPVIWWIILLFFLWLQLLRSWHTCSLLSYWANYIKY